jgi:hypothetical protein
VAKPEEIQVGACLIGKLDRSSEPIVIRCDPDDMFLTYDGENDVYAMYSLQTLVVDYECVDQIPDGCDEDVKRAPKEFQR